MFVNGLLIYIILLASALLFFILDRKIRFAVIPGIIVTVCSWCGLIYNLVYSSQSFATTQGSIYIKTLKSFMLLTPSVSIAFYSVITIMLFTAIGLFIGRLVFDPVNDLNKAQKKAKTLSVTASLITGIASILYFVLDALKNTGGRGSTVAKIAAFCGVSFVEPIANRKTVFIVVFILLIALSIFCLVFINTRLISYRAITPAVSENGEEAKKTVQKNALSIIGLCFTGVGNIGFWIVDAIRKKASLYDQLRLIVTVNIYQLFIVAGLILLAIGLRRLVSCKGRPPYIVPVISAVFIAASYVSSIVNYKDLLNFLSAAFQGSDITDIILGAMFRRTTLAVNNILIVLLIVLVAWAVWVIISSVRASAKKEA